MARDPADLAEEIPIPEPEAPEFSEEAIAVAFIDAEGWRLRFVKPWGAWLVWSGAIWERDEKLAVIALVRSFVTIESDRALHHESLDGRSKRRIAMRIASKATVEAVERLARADRRIAATVEQWDADPNVIATPSGMVDLTTGALRGAVPEDYCSRSTCVAPASGKAAAPLWTAFLERVSGGDAEVTAFLKRLAGYCLTGLISEQALFFLFGRGATGKSTFISVLAYVLGDYAANAPMETFVEQRYAQHPTELAMLQGARLVAAHETEEGRRWAVARIKQLTGGDKITARFMRQDHFTYTPAFKLLFAGNHRPALGRADEAMRRRVHMIPFDQIIPAVERDKTLANRLKAEASAILSWAVEGCLEWRERGLDPPARVRAATDEYFAEEDAIARWLDDCIICEPARTALSGDLFASWKGWAERAGECVGSHKRLSATLAERGFEKCRLSGGKQGFRGLAVRGRGRTS